MTTRTDPPLPAGSLQKQLVLLFSLTLGVVLVASVLGVGLLVERTEQAAWRGRQQEAAQRAAETVSNFVQRQIRFLHLIGLFGLDALRVEGSGELAKLIEDTPDLLEIVYLDSAGKVVAHAPRENSRLANLFTIPQSNWFLRARKGQIYIGDVQRSSTGSAYLVLAIPAGKGNVLVARLKMQVIHQVVDSLRFGQEGSSFIADREGAIIAHSDPAITEANTRLDDHPELFALLRANTASWAGMYRNLQGVPVVGTTIPVPNTRWMIITEAPQSEAFAASRKAWRTLVGGAVFIGTVLALVISVFLNRNFLSPLGLLLSGVLHIKKGNLDYRIGLHGQNEIGQVALAFDEMSERLQDRERRVREQTQALLEAKITLEERVRERTRELEDEVEAKEKALNELAAAQNSLVALSRAAGMAEVATGVLHNVGNVLNSVNVSCNLLLEELRESRVGNLSRVAEMLAHPEGGLCRFLTENPRGLQIPAYLTGLAEALENEHARLVAETQSLYGRIDHIKEIVAMQQTYGRVMGVLETLPPEQLMEDAVKLNAEALNRHKITIVRRYEPGSSLTVDKHKVLQILLNLISNAKYACSANQAGDPLITLSVVCSGEDRIRLEVADNGMGIAQENLTRIFQHGFTTRQDGHGFGLHSCALSARELGGNLIAHSDGPGHGATFILDLPRNPGGQP
jgi:signal transduction histidine kinase